MTSSRSVSLIIPTLCRPESLKRAVQSAQAQHGLEHRLQDIIIVDNDPAASARKVVDELAIGSPVPLIWCHAPVPGVATARNRGLAETNAPLIAFLDDDEEAHAGWLAHLLDAQETLETDVVFGPIRGRVPEGTGWLTPYLEDFFGRKGPSQTQEIDHAYGCGNSLMVRARALPGSAPFNTASDQSGGEDDALFASLASRGGRFGWASEAWVDEFAPTHRATLGYALTRARGYGQGPSQTAYAEKDYLGLFRWMLIGAGQACIYGLASAALFVVRHPSRVYFYDKTMRGWGKLFWMKASQLYGASELARAQKTQGQVSPSASE